MIADRTLLSMTLVATFTAGGASGWMARDLRPDAVFQPTRAESVYAKNLRALRDSGWDDAEMKDAVKLHQDYLDAHHVWWREFLEDHRKSFDAVDRKFEAGMAAMEERVKARIAAGGAK